MEGKANFVDGDDTAGGAGGGHGGDLGRMGG